MNSFSYKAMRWAHSFEHACILQSNGFEDPYAAYECLIAVGVQASFSDKEQHSWKDLPAFVQNNWAFGFISYDLKNVFDESLGSEQPSILDFPLFYFFQPKYLIAIKNELLEVLIGDKEKILNEISLFESNILSKQQSVPIQARISKEDYISKVQAIQKEIQRGNIYEMNFCQEFYAENAHIEPLEVFFELNSISPKPFASYVKYHDKYIICASPERFLAKRKEKLFAQPIKGTSKSFEDPFLNEISKKELLNSEKERSENVMIVDLMRNDLTKIAQKNSVKVEELFGIYTFAQVNQMISTISCSLDPKFSIAEIFEHTFPMGSMTGAPKKRALEIIETYEAGSRGVFSGSIGYFNPNGDFDFNVIIRSILYDAHLKYLSIQVGSAITHLANADMEYEECQLKIKALLQVLKA